MIRVHRSPGFLEDLERQTKAVQRRVATFLRRKAQGQPAHGSAPRNLVHVVLDNGVHDSSGGQATAGGRVDFARVALACGYRRAVHCDDVAGFGALVAEAFDGEGPQLVHARMAPGSKAGLGRPTVVPPDMARRFKAFVSGA